MTRRKIPDLNMSLGIDISCSFSNLLEVELFYTLLHASIWATKHRDCELRRLGQLRASGSLFPIRKSIEESLWT